MKNVPSDNILKLRELTNKLCSVEYADDVQYKDVLKKLKSVIDDGKKTVDTANSEQTKIKCYESMCVTIMTILEKIKFI
jgi:hypothetical protein